MPRVNYDEIAATYDGRYAVDPLEGIGLALEQLATALDAERIVVLDLGRMPSLATLSGWLRDAGFGDGQQRTVDRVDVRHRGREILDDPFLQKEATSELALLDDQAYRAGLSRIRSAIEAAEQDGERALFVTRFDFVMTVGRRR